jgi:Mg/Co/Ni transporter MgtE
VLGQMPTKHVIAMLNSVGANQGADMLLALPADRVEILMNEMTPSEVARLLDGARPNRRTDVLAVIGPRRVQEILARFTIRQFADLVSCIPLPDAVALLEGTAPQTAADLLQELPAQRRIALREALARRQPPEFTSAMYHRDVMESVVRIATRVSWLDQSAGHLLADVIDRPFQIVVRHMPDAVFGDDDLRAAADHVHWHRVAGAIIVTNAVPADSIGAAVRQLRQYGRAVEVVRRINDGDDGLLKRALVRLIG